MSFLPAALRHGRLRMGHVLVVLVPLVVGEGGTFYSFYYLLIFIHLEKLKNVRESRYGL